MGEEALKNLDEDGVIRIGAEVGRATSWWARSRPKGENRLTPEEKLLRAIFGEKAAEVRDTSLKLPPGVTGTVVDVRVFSRRGVDKDERAMAIERAEIERLAKDRDDEKAIQERSFLNRLRRTCSATRRPAASRASRRAPTSPRRCSNGVPRARLAPHRRAGRCGDGRDQDAAPRIRCRGRPPAGPL